MDMNITVHMTALMGRFSFVHWSILLKNSVMIPFQLFSHKTNWTKASCHCGRPYRQWLRILLCWNITDINSDAWVHVYWVLNLPAWKYHWVWHRALSFNVRLHWPETFPASKSISKNTLCFILHTADSLCMDLNPLNPQISFWQPNFDNANV